MDINSIGSLYMGNTTDSASKSKTDELSKKLNTVGTSGSTDEELMSVCKEFEAYFIEQVFKKMKTAMVPESESTDSATETLKEYFEDSLTTEYAKNATEQAQGSNSLAQMLYEQMKRNYS